MITLLINDMLRLHISTVTVGHLAYHTSKLTLHFDSSSHV